MQEGSCWPDDEEAAICRQLMQASRSLGPGLCYVFARYRAAGLGLDEARRRALKQLRRLPREFHTEEREKQDG